MIIHRRFHFGEKPHTCLECGDNFAIHSCLESHYLQHKLEYVQEVDYCGFDPYLPSMYTNFESDEMTLVMPSEKKSTFNKTT